MLNNRLNSITYLKRFYQILQNMKYKMMSQVITDSITKNFIFCMIPHHQAAILMCQNLLNYTNNQSLVEIARNIIKTQTDGIRKMREVAQTTTNYSNLWIDVNHYMEDYYNITSSMIFNPN